MDPEGEESRKEREPQVVWNSSRNLDLISTRREFKHVETLLKFSGMTFTALQQPHLLWSTLCPRLSGFGLLISFIFIATEILYCGVTNYVATSVVVFNFLRIMVSVVLWIFVRKRENRFTELINSLTCTQYVIGAVPIQPNLSRLIFVITCYNFTLPVLASLASFFYLQEESREFYLHCYLYGFEVPDLNHHCKAALVLVFITIENFVHIFFPNVVTTLIFLLCECLRQTLVSYTDGWPDRMLADFRKTRGDNMVYDYSRIRENFNCLRDLASLPILLILAQKCLTLFFALTVILSNVTRKIFIEIIVSSFFAVNALFTFVLLILSASRIREAHSCIREHCLNACVKLRHTSPPGTENLELLSLLRSFVERESMTMTAAGVVSLTRGLFLQLSAALVTYGVIIVQLNN